MAFEATESPAEAQITTTEETSQDLPQVDAADSQDAEWADRRHTLFATSA